MVRKQPASKKSNHITWRSHEPSRLETFSDAAFAFALTLIIVSIEVPKNFDELFETMKGTVSFAVCFTIIFQIWNTQNLFFRKYGLKDSLTTMLNGMLLFVVLMYAYPLKFLSILLFGKTTYMVNGVSHDMISAGQTGTLMIIYSIGYTVIYLIFYFMHINALRHAEEIELSPKEIYSTKTETYINLICAGIGTLAILLAIVLPANIAGYSGFTFFLLPLAFFGWYSQRGKRSRQLFPA
ncbi:MAG: TMEM175 family protein [Bacteroidota bacterium]